MRAGPPAPAAALAGAAAILALVAGPAVLAVTPAAAASASGSAARAASGSPSPSPAPSPGSAAVVPAARLARAARLAVGGPQLAGTGVVVNYPAGSHKRLPKVPATAYVIADARTGQVLAAKDPHGEFAPASTLKVLTAITLIPRLSPTARVVATKRATSVQPNVVGLVTGRRYQVSNLFRALLLISANDAAVALTQATGSFDRGMALINAEAQHLQAYDVVAKQPNGLPAAGQVVSAYDEALIARQALAIPAFMRYDSTLAARFRVKPRHWVTLVNQNTLLTQYRGGIGGKIGWTTKSKATYIGMARRNGVTLIVAVLHCTPLEEITAGERLLNWGFAEDGRVRPVGTLVAPRPAGAAARPATPVQTAGSGRGRPPDRGPVRVRPVPIGSQAEARSSGDGAGLAVGAGVAAAAVFGLGGLARSRRRRTPSGRRR
jgi:D-alanyl-D-alanine carboxypeptidase (penicillin-binding protein 5/6)